MLDKPGRGAARREIGVRTYEALLRPAAAVVAARPALILPRARRQRPPGAWAPAAETSTLGFGHEGEGESEEEGEEEAWGKASLPSMPPTAADAAACLAAAAASVRPRAARGPPPCVGAAAVVPALVAGDVLSSAVSGRAYQVLRTVADGRVGHGKQHVLLARPVCAAGGDGGVGSCGHLRVVIKVADRATYMHRYGAAAAANTSGAAIGELCAHARLPLGSGSGGGAYGTHVLPLLEAMADARYIYMVFPYADGPDAFDRVAATGQGLPEGEARRYFVGMALGVLHLKRHGVSHGDLSLENACLHRRPDGLFSCHLIDLELARLVVDDGAVGATALAAAWAGQSHAGGKPGYASPEGAYGSVLDWHAADAWSLGICLYILLTARPLYAHPDDRAFEILATGGAPALLRHYATAYGLTLPDGAMELVTALLRPDPRDRPTVEEVLVHPWVRPALADAGHYWGWPPQAVPEAPAAGVVKQ